jgi:hypothetical protein
MPLFILVDFKATYFLFTGNTKIQGENNLHYASPRNNFAHNLKKLVPVKCSTTTFTQKQTF